MTVTIKQFLQMNDITTDDVAKEMNISDDQLQKIFFQIRSRLARQSYQRARRHHSL